MRRNPLTAPILTLLVAVLVTAGAPPLHAAEDCFDFSRYGSCPPPDSTCLAGPDPTSCAQDCSTCTPRVDDDGDCVEDEELLNDRDDDGDGLVDEDISCLNTCDPVTYECPTTPVDPALVDIPEPIVGLVKLGAKVNAWSCAGTDAILDVDIELEPYAPDPHPACSHHALMMRVLARSNGALLFQGPASVVLSRRWESLDQSLIAGASGNVRVFRWTLRADLVRIPNYGVMPAALQVPCNQDQTARKHLFFYGYLDIALDAAQPANRTLQRTSLVVGHTPGRFTHAEDSYFPSQDLCGFADVTTRPIPRGDPLAHDDRGWFLVAPGDGFTFNPAIPALLGDYTFGRIRTVPTGTQACTRHTRLCESTFEDQGPGICPNRVQYRHMRACGQDDTVSCPSFNVSGHTKCDTIPNDQVAFFPVGSWNRAEYPADQSANLFEGAIVCLNNFEAYWYGAHTRSPAGPLWRGPADALDIVDNKPVRPNGGGLWLVGSVNWVNEGLPGEVFRAVQFRTMHFFSSVNPDIPRLAPCVATAVSTPPDVRLCLGEDLALTGAASSVVNCCQCGSLQYRWLRVSPGPVLVVQDWSTTPSYGESPGPAADATYRLEVRCTTSKNACVDTVDVPVIVHPPIVVDAGPPTSGCAGATVPLAPRISGGIGPYTCSWTPTTGILDPTQCVTSVTLATSITYMVTVTDVSGRCQGSSSIQLTVAPTPVADAGGPGPLAPPVTIGASPCDPSLVYQWTPTTDLTPPDSCAPLANPSVSTLYCLTVLDPATGCASPPDCVTVAPALCDPVVVPTAIARLVAAKSMSTADVHMEWLGDALADGGYHVYRTTDKRDIAQSKSVGFLAVTTLPGASNTAGDDSGAVAPTGGTLFFYQVVGVCSDGLSEGPL